MIYRFLNGEKEVTVDTYKEYPRFLKVDEASENLVADDDYVQMSVPEGDVTDKIVFFAQTLLSTVKGILKR